MRNNLIEILGEEKKLNKFLEEYKIIEVPQRISPNRLNFNIIKNKLSDEEKDIIKNAYKLVGKSFFLSNNLDIEEKIKLRSIFEKIKEFDFINLYLGKFINENEYSEIIEEIKEKAKEAFNKNLSINTIIDFDNFIMQIGKPIIDKKFNDIINQMFNNDNIKNQEKYWGIFTSRNGLIRKFLISTCHGYTLSEEDKEDIVYQVVYKLKRANINEKPGLRNYNVLCYYINKAVKTTFIDFTTKNYTALEKYIIKYMIKFDLKKDAEKYLLYEVVYKLKQKNINEKVKLKDNKKLCDDINNIIEDTVKRFKDNKEEIPKYYHANHIDTEIIDKQNDDSITNNLDYEEILINIINTITNHLDIEKINNNHHMYIDIFIYDKILNITNREIAKIVGISEATLYRYKEKLPHIEIEQYNNALETYIIEKYEEEKPKFREYLTRLREN